MRKNTPGKPCCTSCDTSTSLWTTDPDDPNATLHVFSGDVSQHGSSAPIMSVVKMPGTDFRLSFGVKHFFPNSSDTVTVTIGNVSMTFQPDVQVPQGTPGYPLGWVRVKVTVANTIPDPQCIEASGHIGSSLTSPHYSGVISNTGMLGIELYAQGDGGVSRHSWLKIDTLVLRIEEPFNFETPTDPPEDMGHRLTVSATGASPVDNPVQVSQITIQTDVPPKSPLVPGLSRGQCYFIPTEEVTRCCIAAWPLALTRPEQGHTVTIVNGHEMIFDCLGDVLDSLPTIPTPNKVIAPIIGGVNNGEFALIDEDELLPGTLTGGGITSSITVPWRYTISIKLDADRDRFPESCEDDDLQPRVWYTRARIQLSGTLGPPGTGLYSSVLGTFEYEFPDDTNDASQPMTITMPGQMLAYTPNAGSCEFAVFGTGAGYLPNPKVFDLILNIN